MIILKKINSIKDDLEPVEKIAVDLKKGSIDLKSLEENKTSKKLSNAGTRNFPPKCIVFIISFEI